MRKWAVVVDDPEMSRSHGLIVEAETQAEALEEGVRRAILADRLGAGVVPDGEDALTYEMPLADRQAQAADERTVKTVSGYAAAGRFTEED